MDRREADLEDSQADLRDSIRKISVYTPIQIFLGTLLGGPFAGVYFLGANFKAMHRDRAARLMWVLGPVLILVFLVVFVLIVWPMVLFRSLPMMSALIACRISYTRQLSQREIRASTVYGPESNWQVVSVALLGLIASLVVLYAGATTYVRLFGQ